jgi:hypothetical protein
MYQTVNLHTLGVVDPARGHDAADSREVHLHARHTLLRPPSRPHLRVAIAHCRGTEKVSTPQQKISS